ncbi:nucleotide triphosphate diphosphatase NUDT15 [Streptomyces sioyaensis]|uniref:nucleotide triphosphate diphosphatase NUDT15 n=1 Tax=Streptomyces sioyaensis TaxID=67364 RepID=UPI003D751041
MPSDVGPKLGVGVVVCNTAADILLGRRIKAGEPESWCLPGGRVEPGESFDRAARRELHEETGIDLAPQRFAPFALLRGDVHGTAWLTAGVRADAGDRRPVVTEPHNFSRWEWFAADALPAELFPASRQLLAVRAGAQPSDCHAYRLGRVGE